MDRVGSFRHTIMSETNEKNSSLLIQCESSPKCVVATYD